VKALNACCRYYELLYTSTSTIRGATTKMIITREDITVLPVPNSTLPELGRVSLRCFASGRIYRDVPERESHTTAF
jgi:hypothetical protein